MFRSCAHRKGWSTLASVAVVGALVLAACGSDDAAGPDRDPSPGDSDTTGATDGGGDETTVKIGYAYPDLEQFAQLSPSFSIGDPEEQIEAALDAVRASGSLPANGVDIQLVIKKFGITDADSQLALCQEFAEEDEVFAVIGGREFTSGAECLATRYDVPIINVNPFPTSTYAEVGSPLFTIRTDEGTAAAEFVKWADAEGIFEGKSLGAVVDPRSAETNATLLTAIEDAGYELASVVEIDTSGVGSENDPVVAQRLQADGVDLVFNTIGSTSVGNIMLAAIDLGYEPEYVDWEFSSHMGNVAATSLPGEAYDGTRGLTTNRVADGADAELHPVSEECLASYEAFSGKTIARTASGESGEFENILISCDLVTILLAGIEAATADGAELTPESLIAGLETLDGLELANWDSVGFSADDHSGADTFAPVVFDAECPCFVPDGDFFPVSTR